MLPRWGFAVIYGTSKVLWSQQAEPSNAQRIKVHWITALLLQQHVQDVVLGFVLVKLLLIVAVVSLSVVFGDC